MKGSWAVVHMLEQLGVEVIFGVCGDTSLSFYESLFTYQPKMKHILTRDERSASFMADAYARISHKPGICECPSGAGALYSVPGVERCVAAVGIEVNLSCDRLRSDP